MQGKVLPERSAPTRAYVGIDVCKEWLDVHIHPHGRSLRVANDPTGLKRLKRELADHAVALVALEATGKHHRLAQRHLHAAGIAVAVTNPLRSRLFAEATGALAKTDAIDARLLAVMAETLALRATPPPAAAVEELQELVRARAAAVKDRTALLNQRTEARLRLLKVELGRRIAALERSIARLESAIQAIIAADAPLARRLEILLSIPGIGPVAAFSLIAELAEELGTRSGKEIAMLSGLAPVACDSGERAGQRHIRGGRARVRTAIYFAALSAARYNAGLRCVYQRLVAAGKRPKVALVAIMRKLVILANTLVREDRLWQPNPA
jgi:transposase